MRFSFTVIFQSQLNLPCKHELSLKCRSGLKSNPDSWFENAVELKPNENTKYNFLGPNVVIEIKFKQKMANICLRMTYPLPHTFEHAPRVLKQLYLSYCNVDRQPETERFENDDIISWSFKTSQHHPTFREQTKTLRK